MNLKDFYLTKDRFGNSEYVSNGEILLVKNAIKPQNLIDYYWVKKLKEINFAPRYFDLSLIPFERGKNTLLLDVKAEWNGHEYVFARYGTFSIPFDKEYIDFVKKYTDAMFHTIVASKDMHLLKFWDYNLNFVGVLSPCDIGGLRIVGV